MQITDLQPWMRGPFELIRHADGHLKEAGDTDRRIALIGFDNAIEVCIDVFLNLHPKSRKGLQISNEEKNQALQNYHTKIEFLDKHIQSRKLSLSIPFEAIVWYHQLRNELYHSGNGMVPEMHVLEGARQATVAVFQAVFDVDISPLLGQMSSLSKDQPSYIPSYQVNDQMEFLRAFIEFEKALEEYISVWGTSTRPLRSVREKWRYFVSQVQTIPDFDRDFDAVFQFRNYIVHGKDQDINVNELVEMYVKLNEATKQIREATRKSRE